MQVTLEAITFNHDPSMKTTGAFYIRRNETQIVQLPEWEKSRSTKPESAPVAYAIDRVPRAITIKASFSSRDAPSEGIHVRAVEDRGMFEVPRPLNVLGSSDEPEVLFQGGKAIGVPFTFVSVGILESGASASDLKWQWQFSTDGKKTWTTFQTTEHRVYTVPTLPACPWEPRSNVSSNVQIPWTEALEYACHWAAGVTNDLDLAATMITRRVYALGKSFLRWQQSSNYAGIRFDLTKFLTLFRNGVGNGQTLNCDDCAAIVSTFANLLGAELSQSAMTAPGGSFPTNPILLLGDSHWRRLGFGHHSVAWKGACLEGDELFDACLQIDGDKRPDRPPQFPKQPTKIRFGGRSHDSYQSALCSTDDCRPVPDDPQNGRQRRKFGRRVFADHAIQSTDKLERLRERYRFNDWPTSAQESVTATSIRTDFLFERSLVLEGWESHLTETVRLNKILNSFHKILRKAEPFPSELVDLNVYECADGVDANEILLRVLSCFEAFLERSTNKALGELAFTDGGASIVLRHDRFVVVVRSVGRERISVEPVAEGISGFLSTGQ